MAEQHLQIKRFNGGISSFEKIGPEFAGSDATVDIFQDPSYATLPRKSVKVSGSTVAELVVHAVDGSPYDTNRYFLDLAGKLYRETTLGAWSELRDITGCTGQGLEIFDDYAYYMGETDIGRYGRLSGTPAFDDNLTSWWGAAITDIQTTGGGTSATDYVPPTSISETATARQTFTAEHDPLKYILINVDVVGTGNWTVTLHDAEDNVVGTATIANASVVVGDNTFTFSTPLRLVIGNDYHFHVTSTVADGGVDTNVNTDLEGAYFIAEYGVLISSEFHMPVVVEDKLIVLNEQYLAVFDQATYNPNAILLDRGFKAISVTKMDEYIVVGAYKGATIDEAEEGRLFYWDTISPSWNYFTDTTSIGAPHALTNTGNKLRGIYGNKGGLYEGDKPFKSLLNKMSNLNRDHVLRFYPNALSGMENITLIATSGNATDGGTSLNIRKGVYAFGAQEESLPDSFTYLYRMSGGNITDNGLKLGFVKVFGSTIYFSWKDANGQFGVDTVSIDAEAIADEASYATLLFDADDSKKDTLFFKVTGSFSTLLTGETVRVGWTDEDGNSTTSDTATEGMDEVSIGIYKRLRAMKAYFILQSTNGTFIKFRELAIHFDDLKEERTH